MKNRTIEVLIDAGSSAVRVAIAEVAAQADMALLGVGCVESSGIRRGVIVDMNQLGDALRRAVEEAERAAELKINSAWLAVSGEITAFDRDARIHVRQRKVSEEDMAQLYRDAAATARDNRYHTLHVLRQQYCVDEYDGIVQPKGMVAEQIGIRVHIIQAPTLRVRNLRLCSESAGIDCDGFVFAGLAASRAVMSEDERQLGCCVADIGAGTIDFVAWHQGQPIFSGSLPIGGEYASSDLAQLLKIPRAYAETLKCGKGSLSSADDQGEVSVSSTGLRGFKHFPRAEVNEILRQRYREMLTMLCHALQRGDCLSRAHAGLILTGGAARIRGLDTFASEVTGLPVRIARPHSVAGLPERDAGHCFAVLLGMAGILSEPFADGVWETPPKQGIIRRLATFFQRY